MNTLRVLGVVAAASFTLSASAGVPLFERTLFFNGDDGPFSDATQQIADSFSLDADSTIGAADWYGNYLGLGDPFDTGDTWDFTVRLFEDNGGLPLQDPLYELGVTATITDGGIQQGSDRIYLFSADLTPVDLDASMTYYLSILSSTNNSFRWNNGEPSDGDLTLRNADADPWRSIGPNQRDSSAFALYGVPAPGAMALLAIAGLTHRRRRA